MVPIAGSLPYKKKMPLYGTIYRIIEVNMDKKIKEVIERIKDIPGLKIGWVFCNPVIMTVDSQVLEYESAKELMERHGEDLPLRFGYAPDEMMPVFWVDEEEEEYDEFHPSESLKGLSDEPSDEDITDD